MAEDLVKAINKQSEREVVEVPPQNVSAPPYANSGSSMSDERYNFLENAFSEGGDSPFGSF